VALRPRLTTGLPLSSSQLQRDAPHARDTIGISCTGVKRSSGGVQAKESVQRESSRKLPRCPYSLGCLEGVFPETQVYEGLRRAGALVTPRLGYVLRHYGYFITC
jgi:hypothetical protein